MDSKAEHSKDGRSVHVYDIGWRLSAILILVIIGLFSGFLLIQYTETKEDVDTCYYYYPEWLDDEEYYQGQTYTMRVE